MTTQGLISLLVLASIGGTVGTSKVEILSPPLLVRPNGYFHQPAEFGFTKCPYSFAKSRCLLTAKVVPIDNSLCEPGIQLPTVSESFVLLAPRGACSYVIQARNAQSLGASGLLLADHTCLCSVGEFCNSNNPCVDDAPVLANDGTASDTFLPTVLLQKQDADAIRSVQEPVTLQLEWAVDQADAVALGYWHLPSPNQDLPASLQWALPHLGTVQFTPKYFVLSGAEIGCDPNNPIANPAVCMSGCTANRKYCAEDAGGVLGAHRLEEAVRRMCIWESDDEKDELLGSQDYWRYTMAFSEACTSDGTMWQDVGCSRQAMEEANIDFMQIAQCVRRSGDAYLEASLNERQTIAGLDNFSVVINSVQFPGETFSETFGAICAGYNWKSLPVPCTACEDCEAAEQLNCVVNQGSCFSQMIELPAPTPPPVLVQPPREGNQETLTIEESGTTLPPTIQPKPTLRPTVLPRLPVDDATGNTIGGGATVDTITSPPTSADQNGELPVTEETNEKEEDKSSDGNEEEGLSDDMKVVIVVAVVGGAILVIFGFVVFLVFKLMKRIKKLEKKEKQTPTTTSPAGSNIWDLPHYVGKEDPFNSECDPIPLEVFQQLAAESLPNANNSAAADGGEVVAPDASFSSIPTTEPNKGVLVTDADPDPEKPPQIDKKKTEAANPPTVAPANEGQLNSSKSKPPEKLRSSGKSETTSERPTVKPRRSSKKDSTWVDIMGKAAPEAKVPKSFSYDDEEKEEIMDELPPEFNDSHMSWDS